MNTLRSREGTIQGDPLAIPFYARSLIDALRDRSPDVKQVWYADVATAAVDLRNWWSAISTLGPSFWYFVNPSKTWLVTKEGYAGLASDYFGDTNVSLTLCGRPVLGSPIGTSDYITSFLSGKVQEWTAELETLSQFAESQPHAAYSALTHGLYSKWNYLARTTPGIGNLLSPLEESIRMKIVPKLTGREPPNDDVRCLLGLPTRVGGLNLINPATFAETQHQGKVICPLSKLILSQSSEYPCETGSEQLAAKNEIKLS